MSNLDKIQLHKNDIVFQKVNNCMHIYKYSESENWFVLQNIPENLTMTKSDELIYDIRWKISGKVSYVEFLLNHKYYYKFYKYDCIPMYFGFYKYEKCNDVEKSVATKISFRKENNYFLITSNIPSCNGNIVMITFENLKNCDNLPQRFRLSKLYYPVFLIGDKIRFVNAIDFEIINNYGYILSIIMTFELSNGKKITIKKNEIKFNDDFSFDLPNNLIKFKNVDIHYNIKYDEVKEEKSIIDTHESTNKLEEEQPPITLTMENILISHIDDFAKSFCEGIHETLPSTLYFMIYDTFCNNLKKHIFTEEKVNNLLKPVKQKIGEIIAKRCKDALIRKEFNVYFDWYKILVNFID